jgi:hypothetical protein
VTTERLPLQQLRPPHRSHNGLAHLHLVYQPQHSLHVPPAAGTCRFREGPIYTAGSPQPRGTLLAEQRACRLDDDLDVPPGPSRPACHAETEERQGPKPTTPVGLHSCCLLQHYRSTSRSVALVPAPSLPLQQQLLVPLLALLGPIARVVVEHEAAEEGADNDDNKHCDHHDERERMH